MIERRWARLIDEHHDNARWLAAAQPLPPQRRGFALGLLLPWVPLVLACAVPSATLMLLIGSALAIPLLGVGCLLVPRLQPVTVGLVLGVFGVLLTTSALLAR